MLLLQKRLAASILDCGKRKVWIDLRHNDDRSKWNGKEGVKYVVQEKEFSEKTGSEWVTKRSVFCEPQ